MALAERHLEFEGASAIFTSYGHICSTTRTDFSCISNDRKVYRSSIVFSNCNSNDFYSRRDWLKCSSCTALVLVAKVNHSDACFPNVFVELQDQLEPGQTS
jgi:hypothetical protein